VLDDLAASVFRRHYGEVFRFVRRRTESDAEAEEITQSVFVKAATCLDPVEQGARPVLGWLYTVAQHRLIDEARRRARRGPAVSLEVVSAAAVEPRYGSEVAAALRIALSSLPAAQRDVVVMRLVEGRSFAEIARLVGASEAACKMRFLRGLSSVRDVFEEEGIVP
jgi:RNA polymerase sigma-70 factor, ECF subfamily